jgi:hypothetical protein
MDIHQFKSVVLVNEAGGVICLPLLSLKIRPNGDNKTDVGFFASIKDETGKESEQWIGLITYNVAVVTPPTPHKPVEGEVLPPLPAPTIPPAGAAPAIAPPGA